MPPVRDLMLGVCGDPRRAVLSAVLLASALAGCSRSCAKRSQPVVYASDEEGGAVVAIDPASATVLARIPVGKRPRGMKVSPDGARLYVALSGSPRSGPEVKETELPPADRSADGIGVVDLARRTLVATLPSGPDPETLDVSPDGKTLFVSNEETAQLSAIDLSSGKVRGVVTVGHEPEGVTVRPDGKVVFVTSEADSEVTAVDTTTLAVLAHVPAGPRPRSLVVTKDGLTAFVADEFGKRVTVVDTMGFTAQGDIEVHQDSPTKSGPRPMGTALSPDGKSVYVTCGRGGSVAILDVATRKQVRSLDGVGDRPWGIATSADGRLLYTANGSSHDVSVLDVATGNLVHRVITGGLPWGVVLVP
jgi:YVTN family beta-propeller protein